MDGSRRLTAKASGQAGEPASNIIDRHPLRGRDHDLDARERRRGPNRGDIDPDQLGVIELSAQHEVQPVTDLPTHLCIANRRTALAGALPPTLLPRLALVSLEGRLIIPQSPLTGPPTSLSTLVFHGKLLV